jgi:hypothetical protein
VWRCVTCNARAAMAMAARVSLRWRDSRQSKKSAEPLQPGAMNGEGDLLSLVCLGELAARPIFRSGYRPSVTWQPQEEAS